MTKRNERKKEERKKMNKIEMFVWFLELAKN